MNEEIITLDIQDDSVKDETQVIEYTEDTKYIEIEEPQMVVIEVGEGVPTTGSVGGNFAPIEHHHQIEEIDDLRDELDTLGLTQDHYSTHGGYAEFRQWKSNGSYKTEDMYKGTGGIGFFVSLVSETGKTSGGNTRIDVCKQVGDDIADVYGVTVIDSGFCGYQHKEYNLLVPSSPNYSNPNYAKVCLLGNADVRITYDTLKELQKSGGYVVPDNNGYAKKSTNNIGFKVISIGEKEAVGNESTAWYYANIALVPQNDNVSRVMQELDKARVNLNNVTIQLGEMRGEVDKVYGVDIGISEKFDNIQSIVNSNQAQVQEGLAAAQTVAQTAQEIANKAQAQMETSASQYIQALNIANGAQEAVSKATEDIGKIKSEMDILAKWPEVDDKNATQSVAGFVAQASKNNATLGALTEVFGDNGSDYTAILQKINASGASIQHIVTHVDKYTLGEYSPTYNLSQDETAILSPGHIYVPTKDTTESSYIYTCKLSNSIEKDISCYFVIDNTSYTFKAPQDLKANLVLEFNLNSRRLFIEDNAFDVKTVIDTNGMNNIGNFEVEYIHNFTLGQSYEWRANDVGLYDWVDYKSVSMATKYQAGENDGDLWYCWQGVYNDSGNVLLYTPDMLYCWDATSNVWISVASVNNNATARVVGVVNQTAEKLTSVYTDLKGNVSSLTHTVNKINSQISDITNNQTSSIHQTAKDIMMGVYSPEQSNYLGLLLSGINSTSTNVNVVEVDAREDNPMWSDDGRCTGIPIWDGEKFVPTENSTEPKAYCIDVVNPTHYYEYADGVYHVYGINNIAIANLSTRVTDTESEVESWTRFQKGQNETMTSINQTSDTAGAAISSMVYGDFRECVEIKLELTEDDDKSYFEDANKYDKQPPLWTAMVDSDGNLIFDENGKAKKQFKYNDDDQQKIVFVKGDSAYCLSADAQSYYKLYYRDDNGDGKVEIVSYEKYQMKSSPYTMLVQKVDDEGDSYIGLVAGNDEAMGNMVVRTINDQSQALISADKISINGPTTFSSMFNVGKTTISGNYIRSGVIESENYDGPGTRVWYGLKIDTNTHTLVQGENTDYIYYATFQYGTDYELYVPQQEHARADIVLYCDEIAMGQKLEFDWFFPPWVYKDGYVVSSQYFDLLPKDGEGRYVTYDIKDGMQINLNQGTIYSKNFSMDPAGNLTITGRIQATSGYIGNGNRGEGLLIGEAVQFDSKPRYAITSNQPEFHCGYNTGDGSDEYEDSIQGAPGCYFSPLGIGVGCGAFYAKHDGSIYVGGGAKFDSTIEVNDRATFNGTIDVIGGIHNVREESDGSLSWCNFRVDTNGLSLMNQYLGGPIRNKFSMGVGGSKENNLIQIKIGEGTDRYNLGVNALMLERTSNRIRVGTYGTVKYNESGELIGLDDFVGIGFELSNDELPKMTFSGEMKAVAVFG